MTKIIKFTNHLGEKFYGLVLQEYKENPDLMEIFWDRMRHPLLPELKVVRQCTVPHEPLPEIGWVNVKRQHETAKVEFRDSSEAKVKWECADIAKLQAAPDLVAAIESMDLMKYRNSNRANMSLKDHQKNTIAAKEAAQ